MKHYIYLPLKHNIVKKIVKLFHSTNCNNLEISTVRMINSCVRAVCFVGRTRELRVCLAKRREVIHYKKVCWHFV